jgi:hypothetical protein
VCQYARFYGMAAGTDGGFWNVLGPSRTPGLSNQIGFDLIRFSIQDLRELFDSIRYQFDSKNDTI